MSIGLDCDDNCDSQLPDKVGASIHHCKFRNNTSDPRRTTAFSASQVFRTYTLPGRGGAVAITINSTFEYNVLIVDCLVKDSYAHIFGGGIYFIFSGYSSHNVTVRDTVFLNNSSPITGALSMGYIEASGNGMMISLNVHNSRFEDNGGSFGGGIFIYSGGKCINLLRKL